MQRYCIAIAREDNDLEKIMGTHFTEEKDTEGCYYIAEEVDAEIATLKSDLVRTQTGYNEYVYRAEKEIVALKERVRDLEEANSQLAGAAIEKLPYKSDLQAENTLLQGALEKICKTFDQTEGYFTTAIDMNKIAREAIKEEGNGKAAI